MPATKKLKNEIDGNRVALLTQHNQSKSLTC